MKVGNGVGKYCRECELEILEQETVVVDDCAALYHKECYDFENRGHCVDRVVLFKDMTGELPRFLLDTYKQMFSMDEDETRRPEEIPDEEVYLALAYTLGYID